MIARWAQSHGFVRTTRSGERDVRNVYLSSRSGECFHIWIQAPKSWIVPVETLETALDDAVSTVAQWMQPSARHVPGGSDPHAIVHEGGRISGTSGSSGTGPVGASVTPPAPAAIDGLSGTTPFGSWIDVGPAPTPAAAGAVAAASTTPPATPVGRTGQR